MVFIPPKTSVWNVKEYTDMMKDTKEYLEEIMKKSDNISIMENFINKKVSWQDWTTNSAENSWGRTLLK